MLLVFKHKEGLISFPSSTFRGCFLKLLLFVNVSVSLFKNLTSLLPVRFLKSSIQRCVFICNIFSGRYLILAFFISSSETLFFWTEITWCFVFSPGEEDRDAKIIPKDEKGRFWMDFALFS